MTDKLLLHPATKKQIDDFVRRPAQSLLLSGPTGSGKTTLMNNIAAALLGSSIENVTVHPYYLSITSVSGKQIGIDEARRIEHFLQLKVPGERLVQRIVAISDAHLLTVEAQNALLKTIEEPQPGNLIIMTAAQATSLLPTVRSRVQHISVNSPRHADSKHFYEAAGFSTKQVAQALAVSGGLPGLMSALLSDEDHSLLQATQLARQILAAGNYQRLLLVDTLAKQPALIADTLFILQQMAHLSLQTAESTAQQRRWRQVLRAAYQSQLALQRSAQPKLIVTDLMLHL